MLIRTQDKCSLIELYNIDIYARRQSKAINSGYSIECPQGTLGEYSSKEKAFKVLEAIEEKYLEPTYINCIGDNEYAQYNTKILYMPADSEVIE